jgi:hypothetical protein
MQTAKLSKVALSMLALAATACAPATTTPPLPTGSASPSASPSAGTTNPTPSPSASADTGSTATPTPNQGGAVNPKLVVLSGTVYDEAGATVNGATVAVKSLDASNPYTANVTTAEGSYVVNNVPEGVNVEISVTKNGFTTRKRVGVFQAAASQKNELNFGSALNSTTDSGSAYFISKYPEVTATEPAYNASGVDNSKLVYKLKLSEGLDDTNRRRFEDAIRVLPAVSKAAPGQAPTPVDLTDLNNTTTDYNPEAIGATAALWPYVIKKGTLFLNDSTTRATVDWNADFSEATLTFNAPLIADRTDTTKYEVVLVAGADKIVDKDNNQLGTDKSNSLSAYPGAGYIIRNAFVPNNLTISGTPANAGERWAATHKTASIFSVNQDLQEPTLTAVTYTKNLGSDSRFELTFNEPIAAFNGTTAGRLDSSITSSSVLDAITFGATDRSGGLKNLNLRGGSNASLTYDPRSSTLFGASSGDIEKEFKLDKNAFAAGGRSSLTAGADNGKMYVEVDPRNPKTLFIYVFNKANIFDTKITDLKVRAEGVGDPAGNTIKSAAADQNQPTGSI